MTSFIKFTALNGCSGVVENSADSPHQQLRLNASDALCYLLEIDDAKILLDCGWSDSFDIDQLESLRRIAPMVDVVLLSHADLEHLGAYVYAYTKLGLECPAYATLAVQNMGQLCMLDAVKSRLSNDTFDLFSTRNINEAFDRITPLKYSQPVVLSDKCKGITITAYAAGHSIGGTIWKIKKDTDEIVYAVDYNHRKEKHLNGTALINSEALTRPSILITDTRNAMTVQPTRKSRETALFETLLSTLRQDGSVLIPIDSTTRVLELAYLLDSHWSQNRLPYGLYFLSHTSQKTMQFAKSMLEWMGAEVNRAFAQNRDNPFEFRSLKLVCKMEDMKDGPKVILTTLPSLDHGFARMLFPHFASADARNTLLLVNRGPVSSLSHTLYNAWQSMASGKHKDADVGPTVQLSLTLDLVIKKKVALEGDELQTYLAVEQKKKEATALETAMLAAGLSDEDNDTEDEHGDMTIAPSARGMPGMPTEDKHLFTVTSFDVYCRKEEKLSGFFKGSQKYRMFPLTETRKRFDDYGEVIQPEFYIKQEYAEQTGVSPDNLKPGPRRQGRDMSMDDDGKENGPESPFMVSDFQEETEIPSKVVIEETSVNVQCNVRFIDFEGLVDGRGIKNILPQLGARKVIFVHGSQETTENLRQYCLESESMTKEIFAPNVGETINVSAATNIFQVKLTDSLVSSLVMHKIGDYELTYLSGLITFPEVATNTTAPAATTTTTPTLDILAASETQIHKPIIIGDVRLMDVRKSLLAAGIDTELVAGCLRCAKGRVNVRKTREGGWKVEGRVGREFYRVRQILYDMHAIL